MTSTEPEDEVTYGGGEARAPGAHSPDAALRILSSLNLDHGFTLTPDFVARKRSLAQVYETIQRFLTGVTHRADTYYPSVDDVYEELQAYKRSISDRVPMLSRDELVRELFILALQEPPFIQAISELSSDPSGQLSSVTRFSAPTEKHPDKVNVSLQSAARNSAQAFTAFARQKRAQYPWEIELARLQGSDQIDLRLGRIDRLLRILFLSAPPGTSAESAGALRRLNQEIQRRIILPCLQQLIRDQVIVSLSCKDLRAAGFPGSDRIGDLILLADDASMERRFRFVGAILESSTAVGFMPSGTLQKARADKQAGDLSEYAYCIRLGKAILDQASAGGSATPLPQWLLDAAVEGVKVGEKRAAREESRQHEAEIDAVRAILERLEKQPGVYRARHGDKALVPDKYLRLALIDRLPGVLACTDPFVRFEGKRPPLSLAQFTSVYLLLRDRRAVGAAVDAALEVSERTGDPFFLFVLENILGLGVRPDSEVRDYAPPLYLEKLRAALRSAYARELSFLARLWLFLTSSEISDARMAAIRDNRRAVAARRVEAVGIRRDKEGVTAARRQVEKVARERLQAAGASAKRAPAAVSGQVDREAHAGVLEVIRGLWERGEYPNGSEILERIKPERRAAATHILEMAVVGAASVRPILPIPLPTGGPIFVDQVYLKEQCESICSLLTRRLEGEEEIVIDNVTMTRKREVRDGDTLRAILTFARGYL